MERPGQRPKKATGDGTTIIPVRCWSCGKPIAQLWEEYCERTEKGESKKKVMDALGLKRYCCRSMFMGHIDLLDDSTPFKKF